MNDYKRAKSRKLTEKILEEEKIIKDEDIKIKKHRRAKDKKAGGAGGVGDGGEEGEVTNIAGKVFNDSYKIYRVGTIYSSDYTIIERYENGEYLEFDLATPDQERKKYPGKYVRRARIKATFQCCYSNVVANDPIEIFVELEDIYERRTDAHSRGDLDRWIDIKGKDAIKRIGEDECKDWNDDYKPCKDKSEILEIINKHEGYDKEIKIPKDVLLRIERIEEMIKEAENVDEKLALQEELKKLKERYNIRRD